MRTNEKLVFCDKSPLSKAQEGSTIMEVTIAMLVIGILVGALLTTVTQGFGVLSRSRQTIRCNQLLQQDLETIRTYTWAQMTNSANFASTNYTDGSTVFSISRSATNYNNSTTYGTNYVKRITVAATWTNSANVVITKQMSTLVTKGGLHAYVFGEE